MIFSFLQHILSFSYSFILLESFQIEIKDFKLLCSIGRILLQYLPFVSSKSFVKIRFPSSFFLTRLSKFFHCINIIILPHPLVLAYRLVHLLDIFRRIGFLFSISIFLNLFRFLKKQYLAAFLNFLPYFFL